MPMHYLSATFDLSYNSKYFKMNSNISTILLYLALFNLNCVEISCNFYAYIFLHKIADLKNKINSKLKHLQTLFTTSTVQVSTSK